MKIILLTIFLLISSTFAFADSNNTTEVLPNLDNNPTNTSVLNDQIRKIQSSITSLNLGSTTILSAALGGTGKDSSNWTAGDLIYMSSTGVWGHETINTNHNIQIITTSGTFTPPVGVNTVLLTILAPGAGGGGGGGCSVTYGGNGGSAGSYVTDYPYAVTGGNSYTVTINPVGAGGAGGANATDGTVGSNGGSIVFDTLTIPGGIAATDSSTDNEAVSLGGFNASLNTPGHIYLPGGSGGGNNHDITSPSGAGGSLFGGIGGVGVAAGSIGNNGQGYGSGGSGGGGAVSCGGNSGFAGGNGAPGIVIIKY